MITRSALITSLMALLYSPVGLAQDAVPGTWSIEERETSSVYRSYGAGDVTDTSEMRGRGITQVLCYTAEHPTTLDVTAEHGFVSRYDDDSRPEATTETADLNALGASTKNPHGDQQGVLFRMEEGDNAPFCFNIDIDVITGVMTQAEDSSRGEFTVSGTYSNGDQASVATIHVADEFMSLEPLPADFTSPLRAQRAAIQEADREDRIAPRFIGLEGRLLSFSYAGNPSCLTKLHGYVSTDRRRNITVRREGYERQDDGTYIVTFELPDHVGSSFNLEAETCDGVKSGQVNYRDLTRGRFVHPIPVYGKRPTASQLAVEPEAARPDRDDSFEFDDPVDPVEDQPVQPQIYAGPPYSPQYDGAETVSFQGMHADGAALALIYMGGETEPSRKWLLQRQGDHDEFFVESIIGRIAGNPSYDVAFCAHNPNGMVSVVYQYDPATGQLESTDKQCPDLEGATVGR